MGKRIKRIKVVSKVSEKQRAKFREEEIDLERLRNTTGALAAATDQIRGVKPGTTAAEITCVFGWSIDCMPERRDLRHIARMLRRHIRCEAFSKAQDAINRSEAFDADQVAVSVN